MCGQRRGPTRGWRFAGLVVAAFSSALQVSEALAAAAPAEDAVRVVERKTGARTEIVLENNLVKLVIAPQWGGGLSEISLKSAGLSIVRPPSGGGFFLDSVAGQADPGDWSASAYEYEAPEGDADESSVHVWRKGQTGSAQYITIHKKYVLKRGDECVRVDYRIENDPRAVNPVTQEYIFRGTVAGRGIEPVYFLPAETGVQTWSAARAATRELTVTPANPWLAVRLNEATGDGLALVFDCPDLRDFGVAAGEACSTVTWRLKPVSIKAGSELAISVCLAPLRGLSDAGKAGSIAAAAMEKEKTSVGPREGGGAR